MLHNRAPAMGICNSPAAHEGNMHFEVRILEKIKSIQSYLHMPVSSIATMTVEKNSVLKLGLLLWLHIQHRFIFPMVGELFHPPFPS